MTPTVSPITALMTDKRDCEPTNEDGISNVSAIGTIHRQNPNEIRDPVKDAARNPATDFRRAKGRDIVGEPGRGKVNDCGRGGVR